MLLCPLLPGMLPMENQIFLLNYFVCYNYSTETKAFNYVVRQVFFLIKYLLQNIGCNSIKTWNVY